MNKISAKYVCLFLAITMYFYACKTATDAGVVPVATLSDLPLKVLSPADNLSSTDKIALGKALFWDPVLSGGKDVACATCHHPNSA